VTRGTKIRSEDKEQRDRTVDGSTLRELLLDKTSNNIIYTTQKTMYPMKHNESIHTMVLFHEQSEIGIVSW
jgi:hypothetical protein